MISRILKISTNTVKRYLKGGSNKGVLGPRSPLNQLTDRERDEYDLLKLYDGLTRREALTVINRLDILNSS